MCAALLADGAQAALAVPALEPHLAAYRLALQDRPGTSGLLEVRGGLVIEWRLSCDGWLSRQRLGFVASTESGEGVSHDVRFSSWESIDGSRLEYSIRRYRGEELDEEYRGEARLRPDSSGGIAIFSTPEKREVDLPPGAIFPTDHLQRVLADAANGKRFVSHEVFDGWGFDALTQITSVIGPPRRIPAAVDQPTDPQDWQAWPISMAYYNVERATDTPEFEASFLLSENGVLRDLILDYGEFRLGATLEKLELIDRPEC